MTRNEQLGASPLGGYMFSLFKRDKTVRSESVGRSLSLIAALVTFFGVFTSAPAWAGPYTITYNANTGTGTVTSSSCDTASACAAKDPTGLLTKTGYTFVSWNRAADGSGASFAVGADMTSIGTNATLYAQWAGNAYTITYDGNTNTLGTVSPSSCVNGTSCLLKVAGTLSKTGHYFNGWNTLANGTGTSYSPGADVNTVITASTTLYAKWAANSITVTYNANGGTQTGGVTATVPSPSTFTYDGTTGVTIQANTTALVNAGYTFAGWNSNSAGTGNDYAPGTLFTGPESITLYAKWLQPTYTVTYDASSGVAVAAGSCTTGSTVTLATTTRTGYALLGWKVGGTGSTVSSITCSANVTVVAQWSGNVYTITYESTGSTAGSAPAVGSFTYPGPYTILGNTGTLAKTGYTFAGWNTSSAGTGTNYSAGDSYAGASNLVLYPRWTVSSYSITYDGNGFTSGSVPTVGSYTSEGSAYVVAANTGSLAKTGYTFAGWNTLADGSGTNFAPGALYTTSASIRLYAKWTANAYAITYDGNGSTGGAVPATGAISVITPTYTIATNSGSLVRAGYTFAGWNTATDGSGTAYSAGTSYATLANLTLYARWTANTYSITYNSNGATDGLAPISATFTSGTTGHVVSDNYGLLDRTGFVFRGWNTQADGKGTNVAVGSLLKPTADTVLYAKWVALIPGKTITLSFAPGSSMLTSTAKFALESLAVYAAAKGLKNISITGYAVASDSRNATTRARIATARATRALNYLLSLDPALNVTTARSSVAKGRVAVVALKSGVAS